MEETELESGETQITGQSSGKPWNNKLCLHGQPIHIPRVGYGKVKASSEEGPGLLPPLAVVNETAVCTAVHVSAETLSALISRTDPGVALLGLMGILCLTF